MWRAGRGRKIQGSKVRWSNYVGSWEGAVCPAHSLHSEHVRYTPMHQGDQREDFNVNSSCYLWVTTSIDSPHSSLHSYDKKRREEMSRGPELVQRARHSPGRFTEPQIQWKGSHSVCLSLVTIPQGPKCEWKLNRSWGQDYPGLFSDLYRLRTKRDQGEKDITRDSHPSPSQWPGGPDDSVISQDKAFPWF